MIKIWEDFETVQCIYQRPNVVFLNSPFARQWWWQVENIRLEHLFSFVNICTSCGVLVRIGSKIFFTLSARLPPDSSNRTTSKTHFIYNAGPFISSFKNIILWLVRGEMTLIITIIIISERRDTRDENFNQFDSESTQAKFPILYCSIL